MQKWYKRTMSWSNDSQHTNIYPRKNVLNNKISNNMKQHIKEKYKFELGMVPSGCHQRNAAKAAIQNFKSHFLSILTGMAGRFHCTYGTDCFHKPKIPPPIVPIKCDAQGLHIRTPVQTL